MLPVLGAIWAASIFLAQVPRAAQSPPRASEAHPAFQTSHGCVACHNGLTTSSGEDVSIGFAWRASMMANSSRDPYWQASVRREAIDHPSAVEAIEDECSICHMPMARARANAAGRTGVIFAHLPIGGGSTAADDLAADGVSCTLCHQIGTERLGTPESFTGKFTIATPGAGQAPAMFGPFEIDAGRTSIMRSATGAQPRESLHVQQSELCATCHTLYTNALGPDGQVIGSLPEQVPYLEWRHSAFSGERSCQACHMPAVDHPTPISSVLGEPREGLSRHAFLGGNFFMLRMLNRYRAELNVEALPAELEAGAAATERQLQADTATVSIGGAELLAGRLTVDVAVTNLTGHKLPTGYPSRRAWLHVSVRDRDGRTVFESGFVDERGAIFGNDNDADPSRYEPHYAEVRNAGEVQIYESVMADRAGVPTTGLLSATAFVKDNRLLPRGFDKRSAGADIAVRGGAGQDDDFAAEGDRVKYVVDVAGSSGPFAVDVELRYQPISFRWAQNLTRYQSAETRRFVSFFDSMASESSVVLARTAASTR
jgi:cytochrome c551/c552